MHEPPVLLSVFIVVELVSDAVGNPVVEVEFSPSESVSPAESEAVTPALSSAHPSGSRNSANPMDNDR
jgi:hypothetical protein